MDIKEVREEFPTTNKSPIDKVVIVQPSTIQNKTREILDILTENGKFTWNESNEIQYRGITYTGSDIIKLVYAFIIQNKSIYKLTGCNEFLNIAIKMGLDLGKLETPEFDIQHNDLPHLKQKTSKI